MTHNLEQKIQQAHAKIKDTEAMITQAQGADKELVQQAQHQISEAEQSLKTIQEDAGTSATENTQFQQAFEQLHNLRGNLQILHQNNPELWS